MNYIDKDKFASELAKISLSNEDITKYGDGFENAIELVYGVINKLPIHIVSVAKRKVCFDTKCLYNSCNETCLLAIDKYDDCSEKQTSR